MQTKKQKLKEARNKRIVEMYNDLSTRLSRMEVWQALEKKTGLSAFWLRKIVKENSTTNI